MTPFQSRLSQVGMQCMTAMGIAAYRISGGRVAGHVPSGAPICLLTTTGRRSGRRRCVPLLYVTNGDELVVVASRGGMGNHPAWYLNLLADPNAVVELGRRRVHVHARTASLSERARLWPLLVGVYENFDAYQARTERELPVVVLSPCSDDPG